MTSETVPVEKSREEIAAEAAVDSALSAQGVVSDRAWDVLVGLLPLLGILPMMIFEAASLWSVDYMRFAPFTLLALITIVGFQLPKAKATLNPYRRWTAIGFLLFSVVVYGMSLWQFSPAASHLALTFVLFAWALGRFGNLHWATVASWALLLATTIRLPGGADEALLNWLQGWAVGRYDSSARRLGYSLH